jgi:UDP-2,3-diacylglucosamine pyrophosphatase LpxH
MLQLQDAPVKTGRLRQRLRSLRRKPNGRNAPGAVPTATSVRALFISDVHLGSKHSQADEVLALLERYEPQHLYLVGDFIDGWKLKTRWRWLPVYDRILQRLLALKQSGTHLYYTPGNHDAFLRGFLQNFGVVDVNDQFVHTAADGKRFLVMHGDQFDEVEQNCQWLSLVATHAYDLLLSLNWWVNTLRGKRHDRYAFCGSIKRRVKMLVKHVSDFESKLIATAREAQCQGIICGHVHSPRIVELEDVAYCNTGDWVESCTALVELDDGTLELSRHNQQLLARLHPDVGPDTQSRLELPARRRRLLSRTA